MTIEPFKDSAPAPRSVRLARLWCRVVSLALFALGLLYWVRLVGLYDGVLWRFDLMPLPWRVAAPLLAVLYPIAGVGLWMVVSWGVVLWVAAALAEGFMLFALPGAFGGDSRVFVAHLMGLCALAALKLGSRFRRAAGDTV